MENPITADVFVTLVCGIVVAFYAGKRYDTPESNRLTTTRTLFLLTGAGYIASSLVLYFLLCEIVLKPGILSFLGLDHAQEVATKFSAPPVLAAVILTTLLPNTAVISAWDAWLLERFQRWGSIPQGVRNLADTMTQSSLVVTSSDLSVLDDRIRSTEEIPSELATRISADLAGQARATLTRILWLYHELQKLEELPAYARVFRGRQEAWLAIQGAFEVFTAQSQAFFVLFDRLKPVEGDAGQDALKKAKKHYNEICKREYSQLANFAAQMLLMVEGTEPRIESRLQLIGFSGVTGSCAPLPIGPFVFMGVIMIIAILGMVAVVRPPHGPFPLAITATLIGMTKTIGVLVAILPKLRWSAFRPDGRGNLPYFGWLTSAVVAAVLACLVERTALVIASHTASAAFDFSRYPLSPMAPTAFALTLAIAIVCDVELGLGHGWARRLLEGILCGATMVATIVLCLNLLDIPSATAGQASPSFPYFFSFFIGFFSGVVAPALYRRERAGEAKTLIATAQAAQAG